jgi:hypothetical protein
VLKKRFWALLLVVCLLPAGCAGKVLEDSGETPEVGAPTPEAVPTPGETPPPIDSPLSVFGSEESLGAETPLVINPNNYDILRPHEAKAMGISLFDSSEFLIATIGQPNNIEAIYEGAFGADVFYYHYAFGEFRLQPDVDDNYYVSHFRVWQDRANGPRGILIGNSMQTVIDSFSVMNVQPSSTISEHMSEFDGLLYFVDEETYGIIRYDEHGEVREVLYQYVNTANETFENCVVIFRAENNHVNSISAATVYN